MSRFMLIAGPCVIESEDCAMEIAEAVNIPLRTVQTRLRSALKKLKKEVERGGVQ